MAVADLRLSGGHVLLPDRGLVEADLLVAEGRIAGVIAPAAGADAAETIGVRGLALLPGAVDPHLHLGHGMDIARPRVPEDSAAETAAAAFGGVTTFIPYVLCTDDYLATFDDILSVIEAGACIDFGMHIILGAEAQIADIPRYAKELGIPTVKFFMNCRGDEGKRLGLPHLDDALLYRTLEALAEAGGMLCPHPESIEIAWLLRDRVMAADPEGRGGLASWNATRPPFIEAEAVRRVCYLARIAGAPVYTVHISAAEPLRAALAARAEGTAVHVETCLHYLLFDETSPIGSRGKVNPPLRAPSDREALWRGIADGSIDTVGTDHVHRPAAAKAGTIWQASPGFPGLEALVPALLTEGRRRGVPLSRLSDLLSRNPARIMGLPAKGQIVPGSDADIIAVDLDARWTVGKEAVSSAGYTVFEGMEMTARVVHTFVRGRAIIREGALCTGTVGTGRYQRRSLDQSAGLGRG
jgi:dihydroorotase (multifunctional complex type)